MLLEKQYGKVFEVKNRSTSAISFEVSQLREHEGSVPIDSELLVVGKSIDPCIVGFGFLSYYLFDIVGFSDILIVNTF